MQRAKRRKRAEPQHEITMPRSDGLSHSVSPAGNHNYYCQCLGFDGRSLGIYVEAQSLTEAWDTASELLRVKEVTSVQLL
jgi:hypothetical protein